MRTPTTTTLVLMSLLAALSGCETAPPAVADAGVRDAADGSSDATPPLDAPRPDVGRDAGDLDDAGDLEDAGAPTDGGERDDASAAPDAPVCALPAAGAPGGPCALDGDCDSTVGAGDGFCLRGPVGTAVWPDDGYCANRVDTCVLDTDCGAGSVCAHIDDRGGAFSACIAGCATGGCACGAGQLCQRSFAGVALVGGSAACVPGEVSAIDGEPCASFAECAPDSICAADPLEEPGGQCRRVDCTIGDDTTCAPGGDGHCVDESLITAGLARGNVCVDACVVDVDCRMADGYRCFDGGGAVGRFCRHPRAGDPCAVETDCGTAAAWDCKIGLTFPGGMCTPTTGCPTPGSTSGCSLASSVCYDSVLPATSTDNVCVDRCGGPIGTQGGCRVGYVCRDVSPGPSVVLGCVNP